MFSAGSKSSSVATEEDDLMVQALGVDDDLGVEGEGEDEDVESDGAFTDAKSYLRSVVKEAKSAKQVCVAPNAKDLLSKGAAKVQVGRVKDGGLPEAFRPAAEWQKRQTDNFAEVRLRLARHVALVAKQKGRESVKIPPKEDEQGKLCSSVFIISLVSVRTQVSDAVRLLVVWSYYTVSSD